MCAPVERSKRAVCVYRNYRMVNCALANFYGFRIQSFWKNEKNKTQNNVQVSITNEMQAKKNCNEIKCGMLMCLTFSIYSEKMCLNCLRNVNFKCLELSMHRIRKCSSWLSKRLSIWCRIDIFVWLLFIRWLILKNTDADLWKILMQICEKVWF